MCSSPTRLGLRPPGVFSGFSEGAPSAKIDLQLAASRRPRASRTRGFFSTTFSPPPVQVFGRSAQNSTRRLTDTRCFPATPPHAFNDERG